MGNGWSEERRAAASRRMRKRWKDPEFHRKQSDAIRDAVMADPEIRADKSAHMKSLNARLRCDEGLERKRVRGLRRSWTPERRAVQAEVMKEVRTRPEVARVIGGNFDKMHRERRALKAQEARAIGTSASPFESI